MNYLAIDTSGKNLTVILCKEDKYFEHFDLECGVSHSTELLPRIEQLALECGFDFKSADFFACAVGPGSFTGIRIGVATIKALCFAYNKPVLTVTSFDTIAYNKKGVRALTVIDAKHDGFYVCAYDNGNVLLEPTYMMRSELDNLIKEFDHMLSFESIEGYNVEKVSLKDGLRLAVESKSQSATFNYDSLVPLYVRKSQAEEGR